MAEPSGSPPLPLMMAAEDVGRVAEFLASRERSGSALENERLLIEILEALRSIDDKLERLIRERRGG